MSNITLGLAVALLIALCAVAVWSASATFANVSGWRRLSERYRAEGPPTGERLPSRSGRVGDILYRNVLTTHVSAEGLFLSALFPGHDTLFFPWLALQDEEELELLGSSLVRFHAGYPPVAIELPRNVLELRRAVSRGR